MELSDVALLDTAHKSHLFAFGVIAHKYLCTHGQTRYPLGNVDNRGKSVKRSIALLDMVIEAIGQGYFLPLAIDLLSTATKKHRHHGRLRPSTISTPLRDCCGHHKKIMGILHVTIFLLYFLVWARGKGRAHFSLPVRSIGQCSKPLWPASPSSVRKHLRYAYKR